MAGVTTCKHCEEPIELRCDEWVTMHGNDPQCDASPDDDHSPDHG